MEREEWSPGAKLRTEMRKEVQETAGMGHVFPCSLPGDPQTREKGESSLPFMPNILERVNQRGERSCCRKVT